MLESFFVPGLAHASYLIADGEEAGVIDPKRDVDDYIAIAARNGLRITAVLETHPHADFVSGHVELARRTGAKIYIARRAPARYERTLLDDGDTIRLGGLEIAALDTPGHSPDSMSFLLRRQGSPIAVFTGDTLFVGDVGRPDLRDADQEPSALAEALYHSLFEKLLALGDEVRVYPAHRAGSLCGRNISQEPFTTIGRERLFNWALQIKDRARFVQEMISNLPDRPAYFANDVRINLAGAPGLDELPNPVPLTEVQLKAAMKQGSTVVVDTRNALNFGAGHLHGSLNVGLNSALFSTWVGFLLPFNVPIALVVDTDEDLRKARLELARIGYDRVESFIRADTLVDKIQTSQLSVCDVRSFLQDGDPVQLIDVRTPGEWNAHHIEGAINIPLPTLPQRLSELPSGKSLAIICGSGYRSSIACSLLAARGYRRVQNVMGGMSAFDGTKCPDWVPADLVFG
ncbi:MAG TPA: MBL fold metallo-hydrolase [Acidobacteriota bacterium]|jgi:glyoxylase-like metal-dependent hydrolase (beta-lactamase superfamily II)/rhodanese-related sulfurtransferase|nr:MBL fold metallo-hydrolase [Acidobacteriota bacterium]